MEGIVWVTDGYGDIVSDDGAYVIEYCGGRWEAVYGGAETLLESTLEDCIDACKRHARGDSE